MTHFLCAIGGVLVGAGCIAFACWVRRPEIDDLRAELADEKAGRAALAEVAARNLRALEQAERRPLDPTKRGHVAVPLAEYGSLINKAMKYDRMTADHGTPVTDQLKEVPRG